MKLQPHFITTDQPSRIWKPKTVKEYFLSESDFPVNESTETFQLLLTSDEPPKRKDWAYNIEKNDITFIEVAAWAQLHQDHLRKIIAAYPPIEGIPNITDEDIAYIVANPESNLFCSTLLDPNTPFVFDGFIKLFNAQASHPEPLFTKEDMEAAFDAGKESVTYDEKYGFSHDIEFNEWLTTHQQK